MKLGYRQFSWSDFSGALRRAGARLSALAVLAIVPAFASAKMMQSTPTIQYSSTHLVGNQWSYAYTVVNPAGAQAISELSIYFAAGLYSNLAVDGTPAGWDRLVIQPDTGLPADGFYDVLALGSGLPAGSSLSGFSLRFDFAGSGTPGAQAFQVIDPASFAVLASGMTTPFDVPPPNGVPEPSSLALAGLGLLACARRRRAAAC
ncbi:MAG: PEP-CTERM sorting domain-containing protein [Pseudomonadota bacterium]